MFAPSLLERHLADSRRPPLPRPDEGSRARTRRLLSRRPVIAR